MNTGFSYMSGLIKENTFGHCVKTKDNIPFKIKRCKQKSEQQKKDPVDYVQRSKQNATL